MAAGDAPAGEKKDASASTTSQARWRTFLPTPSGANVDLCLKMLMAEDKSNKKAPAGVPDGAVSAPVFAEFLRGVGCCVYDNELPSCLTRAKALGDAAGCGENFVDVTGATRFYHLAMACGIKMRTMKRNEEKQAGVNNSAQQKRADEAQTYDDNLLRSNPGIKKESIDLASEDIRRFGPIAGNRGLEDCRKALETLMQHELITSPSHPGKVNLDYLANLAASVGGSGGKAAKEAKTNFGDDGALYEKLMKAFKNGGAAGVIPRSETDSVLEREGAQRKSRTSVSSLDKMWGENPVARDALIAKIVDTMGPTAYE